jgi:hypothetical protein
MTTYVTIKWTVKGLDVDQINAEAERIRGSILRTSGGSVSCEYYSNNEHMLVVDVPVERLTDVSAELIREGYMG